jgi:hypothetical protein
VVVAPAERVATVADRVREIEAGYTPPDFAHVPSADAALFLAAIDHGTGFDEPCLVEADGPYEGSALLWALGVAAERTRVGTLSARGLAGVTEGEVAEMFSAGGRVVSGAGERARLWRDLAQGMIRDHNGSAEALIQTAGGQLAGEGALLDQLSSYEAFSDPLRKKSFLFCKIAERRRWLVITDPENWEVCADSVLMRLALRAGLVSEGPVEELRAATRDAFAAVAAESGVSPPVLDDLLWELGREDPDLLGRPAGDLHEPARLPGAHFY